MNGQYLLFAGAKYYPGKGWENFKGRYDSLEEALEAAANVDCEWWQVVDLETTAVTKEGSRGY